MLIEIHPQASIQDFSENPVDYCDFIHAFKHLIVVELRVHVLGFVK